MKRRKLIQMSWQVVRRLLQATVLLFVPYAALSMHWRNFKVSHNQARLVGLMKGDGWAQAYDLNERFLSLFGEPHAVSDGLLGMPWSGEVAGFRMSDPMAVAAMLTQGEIAPLSMWLGLAVPIGIAVFGGRLFCSHICPARAVFEIGNGVRSGLQRMGLPLPSVVFPKVGLWVAGATLLFVSGAGIGAMHLILPYTALGSGLATLAMTGTFGVGLGVFAAMLAVDLFVAPGQICRSLCPTGALLETLGGASPLRLEKTVDTDCGDCNLCQRVCPYGLFPGKKQQHPSCDACGRCTVVCPSSKLAHTLRLGVKR